MDGLSSQHASQEASPAPSDRTDDRASLEKSKNGVKKSSTPATAALSKKSNAEIYQKLTQLEHVLRRPDTYIGSIEPQQSLQWVLAKDKAGPTAAETLNVDDEVMVDAAERLEPPPPSVPSIEKGSAVDGASALGAVRAPRMEYRQITYVPGLYKIFDEILVNAADNKIRDPAGMDTLKVTINKDQGTISIYNNGKGIPVEVHPKEGIYIPELIFGHLLTSSNYDDDEKKIVGGRNGYGAKLCNIFSKEFIVETSSVETGHKFRQVFSQNMSVRSKPSITKASPKDFTCITFKPDFERFSMQGIDDDLEGLVKKRVYDIAGIHSSLKVSLNGERIKLKNFKAYIEMYLAGESEEQKSASKNIVHEKINDRWEVAVTASEGQFQQCSFVNSIATTKGGTHVDYIANKIVAKLSEALKKKSKNAEIKGHQVKQHIWVFINCSIENPSFDSQTKENMTLKAASFGSHATLSELFLSKIMKTEIIESVQSFLKYKQDQTLQKTDGKKRTRLVGIAKLDDANHAGGRNASKCTLILTEGDSAKALAVSGIGAISGRDDWGVFPLRGKLLNVREAGSNQVAENVEINALKKILGLQHGKVYTEVSSLRYGHLMVMTDQDYDGSHIKGLIINFLDHFYPSLLKVPGFLLEFITPIVKVKRGRDEVAFFTIPEYESWKNANNGGKGWQIKYYKGLGTSTSQDAKQYFKDMPTHRKSFSPAQDNDHKLVDLAFNKKMADKRKEWLANFQAGVFMDHTQDEIPLSDFINKELILYSMADNVRSIPSVVDGLKPGHRKILFACFKRKLKGEIKVAQLAGYVSEHAAYHHGEASLQQTIVGLAANFVGSNNINLLEPIGQFGTRLAGGKDAASARYIYTSLAKLTRVLFHPQDDALLTYLNDDGQSIEPSWYVPIMPMVLVNGSEGIGTGWSSSIPNFNPLDICDNLRRLMKGQECLPLDPWFRGFKGNVEKESPERYRVTGVIRKISEVSVEITELPVRVWTQNYKEQLEAWIAGSTKSPAWIRDYREYHTDTTVHFVVTVLNEEEMTKAEQEGLEKRFKLISTISTSNMVAFNFDGKIQKYARPEDILVEFYGWRLRYYSLRKEWVQARLGANLARLSNQARFIQMVIDGKLVIANRRKSEILKELVSLGFEAKNKFKAEAEDDPMAAGAMSVAEPEASTEAAMSSVGSSDYDYLLSLPLWSLTMERLQALLDERAARQGELEQLQKKTSEDLWAEDLDAFIQIWTETLNAEEVERSAQVADKLKNGVAAAKPARKRKATEASGKHKKAKTNESVVNLSQISSDGDHTPTKTPPPSRGKGPKAVGSPLKLEVLDEDEDEEDLPLNRKAWPEVEPHSESLGSTVSLASALKRKRV